VSSKDGGDVVLFPGLAPWSDTPEDEHNDGEHLISAVEALLFAADEPVGSGTLATALEHPDPIAVERAIHELAGRCASQSRGVEVVRLAGGWRMRTGPAHADAVRLLKGGTPLRLSKAALETLAVVAYRQPVTRAEIDGVRGVGSGGVLKGLIERGLVRIAGRRDEPGQPLQYATTRTFLETFSLTGLGDLPTLAEREELDAE
jgi:segregation and condensation protein B